MPGLSTNSRSDDTFIFITSPAMPGRIPAGLVLFMGHVTAGFRMRLYNMNRSLFKRYGFAWMTLGLFVFSFIGHWLFAWFAYVDEQESHRQPAVVSEYFVEVWRDTLENWQSEFLQILWQVAGLAYFLYVGSPQSKEGDERKEEKLDFIMSAVDPQRAKKEIDRLRDRYPQR